MSFFFPREVLGEGEGEEGALEKDEGMLLVLLCEVSGTVLVWQLPKPSLLYSDQIPPS